MLIGGGLGHYLNACLTTERPSDLDGSSHRLISYPVLVIQTSEKGNRNVDPTMQWP